MYVLSYQKQIERINEMIPLRKNEKTFEVFYHDPQSGKMWKSFFPYRENSKNGPKLLRPEPLPERTEHLLEACLNSGDKSDSIGLGIEYSLSPEKWGAILAVLEENRKIYSRSGFFTFIKHLGIRNPQETFQALKIDFQRIPVEKKEINNLQKRASKLYWKKFFGI